MTKKLTVLMCALILTGFGALAAAEPASSSSSAQASQAVAAAPVAQPSLAPAVFMSEGACPQALSGALMPAPIPMTGCQGGLYGSCDNNFDCKGYACPLGEIRYCFGGTGSGCEGSCGCW